MRGRAMSEAPGRRPLWRRAAVPGTVVGVLVGAVLLAPIAAGVIVQMLQWLLRGSLWVATSVVRGDDAWTIAGAVGRAATTALVSPSALGGAGALLLVGAAALFGLQRLLESEQTTLAPGPRTGRTGSAAPARHAGVPPKAGDTANAGNPRGPENID